MELLVETDDCHYVPEPVDKPNSWDSLKGVDYEGLIVKDQNSSYKYGKPLNKLIDLQTASEFGYIMDSTDRFWTVT